jgi:hypothetical protein
MKLIWPIEMEVIHDGRRTKIRTAEGEAVLEGHYSSTLTLSGILLDEHSYSQAGRVTLIEWDGSIRKADGYADPSALYLVPAKREGTFLFFDGKLREYSGKLFRSEYLSTFGNSYFYGAPGYYAVISELDGKAMLPLDRSVEPEEIATESVQILSADNVLLEVNDPERGFGHMTLSGFPLRLFDEPDELVLHAPRGFVRVPKIASFEVVPDVRSADDAYCQYTRALGVLYADGDYLTLTDGARKSALELKGVIAGAVDELVELRAGSVREQLLRVPVVQSAKGYGFVYIRPEPLELLREEEVAELLGVKSLDDAEQRVKNLTPDNECIPVYSGNGEVYGMAVNQSRFAPYRAYMGVDRGSEVELFFLLNDVAWGVLAEQPPCKTHVYVLYGEEYALGYGMTTECGSFSVDSWCGDMGRSMYTTIVTGDSTLVCNNCYVEQYWLYATVYTPGGRRRVATVDELTQVLRAECECYEAKTELKQYKEKERWGIPLALVVQKAGTVRKKNHLTAYT